VKTLVTIFAIAAALAVAAPAYAINDGQTPAGQGCANSSSAVGTPGGSANPGLATTPKVGAPASDDNPGQNSPGAEGAEKSQAFCND
jgi:hypothetical protein